MSLGEGNEGSGEKKKTVKVSQIKTRINKLPIFFFNAVFVALGGIH